MPDHTTPTASQVAVAIVTLRDVIASCPETTKVRRLATDLLHHAMQRAGWTGSPEKCLPFEIRQALDAVKPPDDNLAKTTELLLNATRANEIMAAELTRIYADEQQILPNRAHAYLAMRDAQRTYEPRWLDAEFERLHEHAVAEAAAERAGDARSSDGG